MKNRKLLFSVTKDDFIIQTFKSGGPGGQNQNKRETGVRIIHKESGAIGEARDSRDQNQNKKAALVRLKESGKFKLWLARKINEIESGQTLDEAVDEMMQLENLKIEFVDSDGIWIEE